MAVCLVGLVLLAVPIVRGLVRSPVALGELSVRVTPQRVEVRGALEGPGRFQVGVRQGRTASWSDGDPVAGGPSVRLDVPLGPGALRSDAALSIRIRHERETVVEIPIPSAGALWIVDDFENPRLFHVGPGFDRWIARLAEPNRMEVRDSEGVLEGNSVRFRHLTIPEAWTVVGLKEMRARGRVARMDRNDRTLDCSIVLEPHRELLTIKGVERRLARKIRQAGRQTRKLTGAELLGRALLPDGEREIPDLERRLATHLAAHFADGSVTVARKLRTQRWLDAVALIMVGAIQEGVAEEVEVLPVAPLCDSFISRRIGPLPAAFRFPDDEARVLGLPHEDQESHEQVAIGLDIALKQSIIRTFVEEGVLVPPEGRPRALEVLADLSRWRSVHELALPRSGTPAPMAWLVFEAALGTFERNYVYTLRLEGAKAKVVEIPIWRTRNDYTSGRPGPGLDRRYPTQSWKNVRATSVGVRVLIPAAVIDDLGLKSASIGYRRFCDGRGSPGFVVGYSWSWSRTAPAAIHLPSS